MTIQAIEDYAASLEVFAESLRNIAESMKTNNCPEIHTKNFITGRDGQRFFARFCTAVTEAFGTQLANRTLQAVQEKKANYEKASKTAGKIQEIAQNELKTVRKKKTN